jgi:hypothetical protein
MSTSNIELASDPARERMEQAAADCGIPGYMIGGLVRYVFDRIPPGGFLRAVLENDLMNAAGRADDANRARLHAYCMFLYNHVPASCKGSPANVAAWLGEPT